MRSALGIADMFQCFVNQTTHGRSLLATWPHTRTTRPMVGLDWHFILLEATLKDMPRTQAVYVWVFVYARSTI